MESFTKLFGSLLVFVYHCFDRIVINGYLESLSRPEQIVHFFRDILGIRNITKEALAKRTIEYNRWVETYARNHNLPLLWAGKGRKEEQVAPYLKAMEKRNAFGVYCILLSMEQGPSFRSSIPRHAAKDPDYRILSQQRSRYKHYYFYIRDEVLGPLVIRVGTFLPFATTYILNGHSYIERELIRQKIDFRKLDNAFVRIGAEDLKHLQAAADRLDASVIAPRLDYWTLIVGPKFSKHDKENYPLRRTYYVQQIEYCRNFIFKRHSPIHKIFERSCDLALWRMTASKIAEMFGRKLSPKFSGKLLSMLEEVEHGQHVFRAYWKNCFLKQYEKFGTFLRNEIVCNNLANFRLKKSLDNLPQVRAAFQQITDRFTGFQAQCLNVHTDFPLLQRLALPIQHKSARVSGIRIDQLRMLRLFEVLMHAGAQAGGWSTAQIHSAVLQAFHLNEDQYSIAQLRYDMRKLKARDLLCRDGRRHAYRLSEKGVQVALLVLLFHKQVCGPLSDSRFHRRPNPSFTPDSPLERAYHNADQAIQQVVDLIAA